MPTNSHRHVEALSRRHLANFRLSRIPHRFTDLLVIGSGIAGLATTVSASSVGAVEVILLTKAELAESSTNYAQGGVAAVLEPTNCDDSVSRHASDTLAASGGLAEREIVEMVVREGVEAVEELIDIGARFDTLDGRIHFTQEGGHSRPRILHKADRTGREIVRVLLDRVRSLSNVVCLPETFAIDLLVDDRTCCGALVQSPASGLEAIWAKEVVLATGGAGRLYRETTNPAVTTGDGIAMAYRAGATLRDMEFVQFHPTTLYVAGSDRFLITEALRGEGGKLIDADGKPFMDRFHPSAELAPRDVVSRGILQRMKETGDNKVYLDVSAIPPAQLEKRFPHVLGVCQDFGIDIRREPVPIRPSAHYTIGGVLVDTFGSTDVPGLFAVGEVSSTGLHGSNRLGSNSLLEGLVFGRRAGTVAASRALEDTRPFVTRYQPPREHGTRTAPTRHSERFNLEDLERSLKSLLWHEVGVERTGSGLENAKRQVEEWISYLLPVTFDNPSGWRLQDMLTTAILIIDAALQREESRGVHYRSDFPETRSEWERHLDVKRVD